MKLPTAQIAAFLQNPDPKVRVILFYGPDAGLVKERAEGMAQKIVPDLQDPFRVALLTGVMVNDDSARLYDEVAAQALGGGRRLIRVPHALEGNSGPLGKLLEDLPDNDSLVLIEAGDLDKRSKLRSLCEGATPFACAIPCYIEDSAQRQRTIADILKAEGLTASREIMQLLADSLPPDRIALRSEVEKLALYARGQKTVEMEDVLAVLQNAGAAEMDDLIHAAASGDARRVTVLLDHLFAEQTSPVAILRAAQRHFLRLQLARAHCDNGLSVGEAVKKLSPPVFWKHVEPMSRQVQRWPALHIERFLQRLYDAEAAVKRTGTPDVALCSQLLVQAAGGK